ncbi:hypothetical protein T643_A5572 [Klebsiella pneumoniae MRSN 1319]|uniref:Uncharacterized protein n=1 Tax=Klebsiella pneumoniae TaxID=573 RepID=A0A3S6QAV6_KLEPN|nr:hypothetical protein CN549_0057 [Klebsiella pneumoniae]KGT65752.1 hypothetical protein T643_A5572 [Klebsiella pneumoniae MRSN 1319]QEP09931.1 hypothetical protein [Klebsiella pneumoniae]QGW58867.1 hypothetical protein pKpnU95_00002 [Klebsiella pneumoniae]QJX13689.1 hypothetical protein [Klebsiella pneumoniae]
MHYHDCRMHTQLVIDCEVHHAYYSQYSLSFLQVKIGQY